jgi:hypothetical protein
LREKRDETEVIEMELRKEKRDLRWKIKKR